MRTRARRLGAVAIAAAAGLVSLMFMGQSLGWIASPVAARPPMLCRTYSGVPQGFGTTSSAGMVRIPAGSVQLGSRDGYPDERPTGETLHVPAFWMDRTEVTNAQFAAFVKATAYVTDAEREGAAAVFQAPRPGQSAHEGEWWVWRKGANWRLPQGPNSEAVAQPNEPVVLVTYADALAYAHWLGHELPAEAEWEYAARGGGSGEQIGREPRDPKGRPVANYWQGIFPDMNTTEDGYAALAPVGCFPANGYGLFDMIGNVWELTRDRYSGPHQPHGNGDPTLSIRASGGAAGRGERLVIKGGSFLCSADYCVRYRATARYPQEADMATSHVGFRTILREAREARQP
jgi:formylglycine-generating enzyme